MFSTTEVIEVLRAVNPCARISEDRVRHAIRRGAIPAPDTFAGRYAWTWLDIRRLATALGLQSPDENRQVLDA